MNRLYLETFSHRFVVEEIDVDSGLVVLENGLCELSQCTARLKMENDKNRPREGTRSIVPETTRVLSYF